jgi:hypothetical protein
MAEFKYIPLPPSGRYGKEMDDLLRDTWLVATKVLREQITTIVDSDLWGQYPDIGESDWEMVLEQLARMMPPVPRRKAEEAYDRLADRAVQAGTVGDGPWEAPVTSIDTGGRT